MFCVFLNLVFSQFCKMALENLICKQYGIKSCKPTVNHLSGFLNETLSDVTVTVSYPGFPINSYKLHRNVLSGCSSVLQKLMADVDNTLDITYMCPTEFELLVVYMYSGNLCFNSVSELCFGIYAAKLFNLEAVRRECKEKLLVMLEQDCDKAVSILQLDERFNNRSENKDLFKLVDAAIQKNYRQILKSRMIENLERDQMELLMQMNSISDVPEIEVFRALFRWTKATCNKDGVTQIPSQLQEVAGDLITHVRFNLIPVEVLGGEVVNSGLLSTELIALAFQRIYNDKMDVPFCTHSRKIIFDKGTSTSVLDQEEKDYAERKARLDLQAQKQLEREKAIEKKLHNSRATSKSSASELKSRLVTEGSWRDRDQKTEDKFSRLVTKDRDYGKIESWRRSANTSKNDLLLDDHDHGETLVLFGRRDNNIFSSWRTLSIALKDRDSLRKRGDKRPNNHAEPSNED